MLVIRDLFSRHRPPRTAFVLGGGGTLGAVQVGMLQALLEAGVVPDLLVGCSVGALNASAIAYDPTVAGARRLRELWWGLRARDVFVPGRRPWQIALRGEAMYSNEGLRSLIETWLPARTFEELAVPLHVVATNLETGVERWFSSGPLVEPLLASAALPAVFPPVRIGSEVLIDGGVVNPVPVSRAVEEGGRRIYVLHVASGDQRTQPRRPIDVLVRALWIARAHRFRTETARPPDGVQIITLPAPRVGPVRYTDLSRSRELIERGYALASAFLEGQPPAAAR